MVRRMRHVIGGVLAAVVLLQATPAIANGCIYLRSDKWLYCVGAKK